MNTKRFDLLSKRLAAACHEYGAALSRVYEGYKQVREDCTLSPEDAQDTPVLYDGLLEIEHNNDIQNLIVTYLAMMQVWRDCLRGCTVNDEPIDNILATFKEWAASRNAIRFSDAVMS
jgi:hypothetical protein